ncbi:MAG: phosphocholine cytidylyltransferase family protein [bacterium]|nr:phosphocholine cytidylyltransferase family protein [bacterium]
MKAVIVAAGEGKRLRPYTEKRPKPLVFVGGKPIIHYTLSNLKKAGINEVGIVTGYLAEKFKEEIGNEYEGCRITYLLNDKYTTTDNLHSLFKAREYCKDGFVFLNADVITQHSMFKELVSYKHPDVCVVDDSLELAPLSMKSRVENCTITAMSRDLKDGNARAIGIYKWSKEGSSLYFAEMEKLVKSSSEPMQIEMAIRNVIQRRPLYALPVKKNIWFEIDEESDLKDAEKSISLLI